MPYRRPASVPPGRVWRSFQVSAAGGSSVQRFEIRDLDLAAKEEFLDMMLKSFLESEPLSVALGVPSDPDSVATIRSNWSGNMEEGLSLVCYHILDNGEEFAGGALCQVFCDGEESDELDRATAEPWRNLLQTLIAVSDSFDVFSHFAVRSVFTPSVITVPPKFRGRGVATELLKAAESLAIAISERVSTTICTAVGSHVAALKCGYETLSTFPLARMSRQGVDLSHCQCDSAWVVGKALQDSTMEALQ